MDQTMKKLLLGVGVFSITFVGGCSSNTDSKNDNTTKTETKTEGVKLIKNKRYVSPKNPTQPQIKAYNALSAAVEKTNEAEEGKQVAVSFAFDYFMLSNKKSSTDMGGLQFIPSNMIRKFMEFSQSYYYGNYATIVNEYGEDSLPEITGIKVSSAEKADILYVDQTYTGYKVKLAITYADTDVPAKALMKNVTVNVIKIHDYDFNRSYNYKKADLVFEGELKECWRVISVE